MLKSMLFFIIVMVICFLTPNLFFLDRVTIGKSNGLEFFIQSENGASFLESFINVDNSNDSNNINNQSSSISSKEYTIKNIIVPEKIKLLISAKNEIIEINFDDYIKGVLIGEVPVNYELEALKAQAVVARTYTLHKLLYNSNSSKHKRC